MPPKVIRLIYRFQNWIIPSKSSLHLHKRASDVIYLLANGPALNEDIRRYSSEIIGADKLVVNYMALDKKFVTLKPNLYLLCDPAYFSADDNLEDVLRDKIHRLRRTLIDTVTWKMKLIDVVYSFACLDRHRETYP